MKKLAELYAALAQRQPVKLAQEQVAAIYEKVREAGDVKALRVASDPYKKLQDEVRPALIYAAAELPLGDIQFHLSDRGPDATAWPDVQSSPIPIEVTVASGKVRHRQMTALNEIGIGHGFTDATDADTPEHIKARYEDWGASSPEQVCENIGAAIRLCVFNKAKERHRGRTLVILVAQNTVLAEEWDRCMPKIGPMLPQSPCQAIFAVGRAYASGNDVCYKLK